MVGIFSHIQTGMLLLILNTFVLMTGCAGGASSTIVKSPPRHDHDIHSGSSCRKG
jgi:hypothetical protein